MSDTSARPADEEGVDPVLERIHEERKAGELETAMMSGSDDGEMSATERFEGEMSREEALQVLAPEAARAR